jgi:hypothetical protein
MDENFEDELYGEVIHRYTRRQAIDDGTLVDLMVGELAALVREAGFKYPVAMTATAFDLAVWPIDNDDAGDWLGKKCQDIKGRLWDVLWMLKLAIRAAPHAATTDGATLPFRLSIVNHQTRRRNTVTLVSHCGPGDDSEPVVTIMLPGED